MLRSWKKEDSTSLLMCGSKFRFWSKITPRFLVEGLTFVARGPIQIYQELKNFGFVCISLKEIKGHPFLNCSQAVMEGINITHVAWLNWKIQLHVISIAVVRDATELVKQVQGQMRTQNHLRQPETDYSADRKRTNWGQSPRYQPTYKAFQPGWIDHWCQMQHVSPAGAFWK